MAAVLSAKTIDDIQLTDSKSTPNMKHFPLYVIVSELLFEIVLALRDNIYKHLEMIKSCLGVKSFHSYNFSSKSYITFNFLLH